MTDEEPPRNRDPLLLWLLLGVNFALWGLIILGITTCHFSYD